MGNETYRPEIKKVKVTDRIYLSEISTGVYFFTIVDSDGEVLIHEYIAPRQLIKFYETAGKFIRNEY